MGFGGGIDIDVDVDRGRMANILPTLADMGKTMSIHIGVNVDLCGSHVNHSRSMLDPGKSMSIHPDLPPSQIS